MPKRARVDEADGAPEALARATKAAINKQCQARLGRIAARVSDGAAEIHGRRRRQGDRRDYTAPANRYSREEPLATLYGSCAATHELRLDEAPG